MTTQPEALWDVDFLKRARSVWKMASAFPPDKERVYPEHAAAQEFDLHRGKDVLEYGCGGGSDVMSFGRRGNRVVAVDIVQENLEATVARWKGAGIEWKHGGTLQTIRLDASAPLPIPSESFDVVSSHGVVHHIPDAPAVVAEFARVLRPGGLCYVMLYTEELYRQHADRVDALTKEGATAEEAFGVCTDGSGAWARWYTEDEGRELLEQAGFVVERAFLFARGIFRTFKARKPGGGP